MMSKAKVLLVEDEPNLLFSLRLNLEAEGYEVCEASTGPDALMIYGKHAPFDAILLDVMLPGLDGFEIAEKIRANDDRCGILMLTARAADQDRIRGFESGVDDYITKPFHLQELLLRVRRMIERAALLKKGGGQLGQGGQETMPMSKKAQDEPISDAPLTCAPFRLRVDTLELETPQGSHVITALEADLLKEFIINQGRVLSREYLLDKVWKLSGQLETRTVDNFVMRLRRYLEPNIKNPKYLQSIRGRGYRLLGDSHVD